STRTPEVCLSALWQRTQYCLRNGLTSRLNVASSASSAQAGADANSNAKMANGSWRERMKKPGGRLTSRNYQRARPIARNTSRAGASVAGQLVIAGAHVRPDTRHLLAQPREMNRHHFIHWRFLPIHPRHCCRQGQLLEVGKGEAFGVGCNRCKSVVC